MKKILIAAAMLVSTAVLVVESIAASQVDDAINQAVGQFNRCFADEDAKCVGAFFVDDATYMEPTDGKILKGRGQILKALTKSMSGVKKAGWKLTYTVLNLRMIGESHVFVDTTVKIEEETPSGKPLPEAHRAVMSMVLKDGAWLFEDLRSYFIRIAPPEKNDSAAPAEKAPGNDKPASPPQG